MSAEVKTEKPVKKARFFGDGGGDESKPKVKVETDGFDGEVIKVDERPRFRGKRQWDNKGKRFNGKFDRNDRTQPWRKQEKVQLTIDPYALDRHRREYNFHPEKLLQTAVFLMNRFFPIRR